MDFKPGDSVFYIGKTSTLSKIKNKTIYTVYSFTQSNILSTITLLEMENPGEYHSYVSTWFIPATPLTAVLV